MLGEDLDIGLYAEDAYAAYITQVATMLDIVPEFCSARGGYVGVVFSGPFMSEATFLDKASSLLNNDVNNSSAGSNISATTSIWERLAEAPQSGTAETVVLHAWIEKLNGHRKVQLTEPVQLLRKATQQEGEAGAGAQENTKEVKAELHASPSSHRRVLGNLDFLLHLSTHDLLFEESSARQDALSMDKYDGCSSSCAGEASEEVRAASLVRDALEQRDDVAIARNAVDTVIKFARLAEEHAGEVATVLVDTVNQEENLQFDT